MCGRWERYWFAAGGRHSIAILRIAIAISVWFTLNDIYATWPANAPGAGAPPEVYRPVGLWMLFGSYVPGPEIIEALWLVARIATIAMLLGFCSRASTAISFVASVALASLFYSGFSSWSHDKNIVLLAQLALLGGRSGDALSLDALVRRLRRLPVRDEPCGYQWSIRLVQIAVALMFASALVHKLRSGGATLDWAFSDNLRHQLLVRFDASGLSRTPIADWLIGDVWRFRAAAVLNLVMQALPLVGCLLVRRPIARAVCGACFVLETLGLGLVMDLWNLEWLPLAVVFVDWERLVLRRPVEPAAAGGHRRRGANTFIIAFLGYYVVNAFVPRIDQQLNTYPFTGFPMFASIRARKPYGEHAPYTFASGHFEIVAPDYVAKTVEDELDRYYTKLFRLRDRDKVHTRLTEIFESARGMHPAATGLRMYYAVFEVPAYPAPASVVRRPLALLGELAADGTFHSLLGSARRDGAHVVLTPGESASRMTLEYYVDERAEPHAVAVTGDPPWRVRRPPGKDVVYVAVDGDRRWVIAQTRR